MNLAYLDRNALLGDPRLRWRCPWRAAQLRLRLRQRPASSSTAIPPPCSSRHRHLASGRPKHHPPLGDRPVTAGLVATTTHTQLAFGNGVSGPGAVSCFKQRDANDFTAKPGVPKTPSALVQGGQRDRAGPKQPLLPRWRHAGARPTRRATSWPPAARVAAAITHHRCCQVLLNRSSTASTWASAVATSRNPQPSSGPESAQPRQGPQPRQPAVCCKTWATSCSHHGDGLCPFRLRPCREGGSRGWRTPPLPEPWPSDE